MAANYLHGVETVEVERGPRPVRTVKSAVIGLIGTAPIGAVNVSTLTLS
ncbi:MAG: phage tail sheath family protein, partial [Acidovorax sp.]|nr:phage tail sheath family protein [Acidovorax sp.]